MTKNLFLPILFNYNHSSEKTGTCLMWIPFEKSFSEELRYSNVYSVIRKYSYHFISIYSWLTCDLKIFCLSLFKSTLSFDTK